MAASAKRGAPESDVDVRSAEPAKAAQDGPAPAPAGKSAPALSNRTGDGTAATATQFGSRGSLMTEQGSEGNTAKKKRIAPAPPTGEPAMCPRCGSNATKFCYYNNYNVSQPRYFCKDCQRYWTVGGVLRNVPPGSGRRKSRSAASRETRKQASNLAATPESNAGSSETTLPAPENLMNSNPLASVLMSNMGLSSGAVQRTQTCGPMETQSVDLSNQTSDTTQRLQGIMPLLQTSGVNPFASSAPYATGSLFNVKQQDDSKAAAAPASAFVQHAPAKAAKGEPETVANSQQAATGGAQQKPFAFNASAPANAMANMPHNTNFFLALMQQQAAAAAAAQPQANNNTFGAPALANTNGLMPSLLMPDFASAAPVMQMLLAQNAAWLNANASANGLAAGLAGMPALSPALFPGLAVPGGNNADALQQPANGQALQVANNPPSQSAQWSQQPPASDPARSTVPPIAPLRTSIPGTQPASQLPNPLPTDPNAPGTMPGSLLWAQPQGSQAPQLGAGALGGAPNMLAQAQALQMLQSQMQNSAAPGASACGHAAAAQPADAATGAA